MKMALDEVLASFEVSMGGGGGEEGVSGFYGYRLNFEHFYVKRLNFWPFCG